MAPDTEPTDEELALVVREAREVWFEGCEYINPDLIAQHELGDGTIPMPFSKPDGGGDGFLGSGQA